MSYPCPELDVDEFWLEELPSLIPQGLRKVYPELSGFEDLADEEDATKVMHAHPNTPAECWYDEGMTDNVSSLSATADPTALNSLLQTPLSSPRSARFTHDDLCLAIASARERQGWAGDENEGWGMEEPPEVVTPGGVADLLAVWKAKGLAMRYGAGVEGGGAVVDGGKENSLKRAGRRMLGDEECEAAKVEAWAEERGWGLSAAVAGGVGVVFGGRRVHGARARFFVA